MGKLQAYCQIVRWMTMSETTTPDLNGVPATLLITLYIRAVESQRTDALIKDERAEVLVRQFDQESLRKTLALTEDPTRVVMILKSRDFDRFAQDFLARHPDAVVLHADTHLSLPAWKGGRLT
jgi:O-methyltransferase involved in polyketide biosynthesis